jgi:hypothetical protein
VEGYTFAWGEDMTDLKDAAPPSVTEFLKGLRTAAWRTAGARYNAYRRLKRRDWLGTLSIGAFSTVGIIITMIEKVYGLSPDSTQDKLLSATSICIGISVIVISLLEWGTACAVRADALYRNAEELNAFQRKLEFELTLELEGDDVRKRINELREEYERIKQGCPYNHEPIDEQLFGAWHRDSVEYASRKISVIGAFSVRIGAAINGVSYFAFLWAILAVLLWLAWTVA